jgi:hypothetical protein
MRTLRRVVAGLTTVLVSGALAGGCADASHSPTGPATVAGPRFQAGGAETVTTTERVPVIFFAPTCEGGVVELTGEFHILSHVTISPSGNVHAKFHINPSNLTGEIAGVTYHGTGETQEEFNSNGPLPITDTFVNNFRIIAQGSADNYLVHNTFHITINANGTVTSVVDNSQFDCQG